MTRTEMLIWVKDHANYLDQKIKTMVSEGVFETGDYTWQDNIFEDSGVDVVSFESIDSLTDKELFQIVDAYI